MCILVRKRLFVESVARITLIKSLMLVKSSSEKKRRLSKLQKLIINVLERRGQPYRCRDLSIAVAKQYGGYIPNPRWYRGRMTRKFSVSFSRSLKNLEEKGLAKRDYAFVKSVMSP